MEGNIMDYLAWRGDITFAMSPFNEIDNLILSEIIYADIDKLVPGIDSQETITIEELANQFELTHTEKMLHDDKSLIAQCYKVLLAARESERFKHALVYKFSSIIDNEKEIQFAAMQYKLDDGSIYVAFRGTDDTLVGWKENFNMSYTIPVPSQTLAMEYLNNNMDEECIYRIGGHSKGGNLAVYAAVMCNDNVRKKIAHVYSNDGPGFVRDIPERETYKEMADRITTIVPESSIVGMLMEHSEHYEIVKSDNNGISQHDGLSWKLVGKEFVKMDHLGKDSIMADETITNWLVGISDEERERFVNSVYEIITSTGMTKLSQLNSPLALLKLNNALKKYNEYDENTQKMLHTIVDGLAHEAVETIKNDVNPFNNGHLLVTKK